MKGLYLKKTWVALGLAGCLLSSPLLVNAAGFQLFEQNASGLGDAHAGYAAAANDASTGFYNPAGLVHLKQRQIELSATVIQLGVKFSGRGVGNTFGFDFYNQTGTAEGGDGNLVAGMGFATPLSSRAVFGFNIVAPFGLQTRWSASSIVRNSATNTYMMDLDFTPSLGYAINNHLSIGAGLDLQYIEAVFSQVAYQVIAPNATSESINTGRDIGLGYHLGLMYQFSAKTRVGLSYHSQTSFHLKGHSIFVGVANSAGGPFIVPRSELSDVRASVRLPPYEALSIYHDVNKKLSVAGTISFTQWGIFKNLALKDVNTGATGAAPVVLIHENFHNAWFFALGAHYRYSQKWMFQAGLAYDQTPVSNGYRNIRLPDESRIEVSIGARDYIEKNMYADVGYMHMFVKHATIDNNQRIRTNGGLTVIDTVDGEVRSYANLVGMQLTWKF